MRTFGHKKHQPQQRDSNRRVPFPVAVPANSILHLQRVIGNQAVQRLLQANVKENIDSASEIEAAQSEARPQARQHISVRSEPGLYRKPRSGAKREQVASDQKGGASAQAEAAARDYTDAQEFGLSRNSRG